MSTLAAWAIGLHLATYHAAPSYTVPDGSIRQYQGSNPGVYVVSPEGLTAGVYRNSRDRTSVYAGWSYRSPHPYGDWGLTLGAATGYDTPGGVTPMVVPSVRLGPVRLAVFPKVQRRNQTAAVHLSVEYRF